jgi:hypothetical protein
MLKTLLFSARVPIQDGTTLKTLSFSTKVPIRDGTTLKTMPFSGIHNILPETLERIAKKYVVTMCGNAWLM